MAEFNFNSLKNQVLGKGKNSAPIIGKPQPHILPENEHNHSRSNSNSVRKTKIKEKQELLVFQLKNGEFFDFFKDAGLAVNYIRNKDYRAATSFVKRLISLCSEFGYTVAVAPEDTEKLKRTFLTQDLTDETKNSIRNETSNFMNDLKNSIALAKKEKEKEGIEIDNIEQLEMWPNSIKAITDHALNTITQKFADDVASVTEEVVSFAQLRGDLDPSTLAMFKGLSDEQIVNAISSLPQLAGYAVLPNKLKFIQSDKKALLEKIKENRKEISSKAKVK